MPILKPPMKKYLPLLLCLVSIPVAAHSGHSPASSFAAGLAHPLVGLDHLLAMLGIGLWSRKQEQPLALPMTFLLMMALGACFQFGAALPESAIAASVLVIGVLVAAVRLPPLAAIVLVAGFAFLHGQAHGRELPELASAAGYMLSSAALLMLGRRLAHPRMAGAVIGGAGLCLLVGVV
jgi:urease accessory protein